MSGPSQIGVESAEGSKYEPLATYLASNEEGYKEGLPYLLKVLSIGAALSIQAHPDSKLAGELHASFPDLYRDPNHKPELAIALTPMDAMCSFRDVHQIAHYLTTVPEFAKVVNSDAKTTFLSLVASFVAPAQQPYDLPQDIKDALRNLFHSLMTAPSEVVKEQLLLLLARLPSTVVDSDANKPSENWKYLVEMIQTISKTYPGDVGVFAVFLLNVLRLAPGEAIFLAQNEPHAYLFGDCVECMATSDNVVRAGLTPKFKDVDTLVRMLTYKVGLPKIYSSSKGVPNDTADDALSIEPQTKRRKIEENENSEKVHSSELHQAKDATDVAKRSSQESNNGKDLEKCTKNGGTEQEKIDSVSEASKNKKRAHNGENGDNGLREDETGVIRTVYAPPVDEFVVERFFLLPKQSTSVENLKPTIFLCTEGGAGKINNLDFSLGSSYFGRTGSKFTFTNNSESPMTFFKATQPS